MSTKCQRRGHLCSRDHPQLRANSCTKGWARALVSGSSRQSPRECGCAPAATDVLPSLHNVGIPVPQVAEGQATPPQRWRTVPASGVFVASLFLLRAQRRRRLQLRGSAKSSRCFLRNACLLELARSLAPWELSLSTLSFDFDSHSKSTFGSKFTGVLCSGFLFQRPRRLSCSQ